MAIPGLNLGLVLVILGLIGSLAYAQDEVPRLLLVILVLPVVAVALGNIPTIGLQLGTIATNVALAAAGAAATIIAIRLYNIVKDDLLGLAK